MSKVIRATALVLLLACSAQAGWVHNESPAPPPPPAPASAPVSNDGSPAPVDSEEAPDEEMQNDLTVALAEAALSVLNSGLLSLL